MSTAYLDQLNLPALGLGFVDEENYVWIACASNDSGIFLFFNVVF
jgi:hypothetical protein